MYSHYENINDISIAFKDCIYFHDFSRPGNQFKKVHISRFYIIVGLLTVISIYRKIFYFILYSALKKIIGKKLYFTSAKFLKIYIFLSLFKENVW